MADLSTDVRYVKGVGEQRAKALNRLGIFTLQDLIAWFPRRYEDRTQIRRIADLAEGETACTAAMVAAPPTVTRIRKGMELVKLRAVDDSGVLDVTFFNQTWLKNSLQAGETAETAVPHCGASRTPGIDGPDRAHLPFDSRRKPAGALPLHPPGTGRLRRNPSRCAAG